MQPEVKSSEEVRGKIENHFTTKKALANKL